ncbi:hypothetical protein GT348_06445 [Aristophania vespae]|uniref:Uncharacterized protein n=1 Tax=Aristophania vespae TaxID=2697033 RepID=A0A6P1NEQ6_9PROT|nr:hypothetical protein [Aristophania vespae]QHI95928.1 hypothetical protein GT348_06445 [Aristophania vespae]UMM63666.1 hypothetical protein DM15PD_06400 [Aristophania vespae]
MTLFRSLTVTSLWLACCAVIGWLFLAPQSWAVPCDYDVKPLPSVTAEVTRITPQGVLLEDGTEVILPESLLPLMRLEHEITVRGLHSMVEKKIWALALQEGDQFICPSNIDVKKGPYPGSAAYDIINPDEEQSDKK